MVGTHTPHILTVFDGQAVASSVKGFETLSVRWIAIENVTW
jgi:hypothetical protein